jgi:hypothetical protein
MPGSAEGRTLVRAQIGDEENDHGVPGSSGRREDAR